MVTSVELLREIKGIFGKKWESRVGRVVPDSDGVSLGNDAIEINGAVLYADMSDSTGLVKGFKPWFAAEIYKAYLCGACRVIQNNQGEITAFDGDRVMAVFIGDFKNTNAVKAALQINYIVSQINTIIKQVYPTTSYILRQKMGVDMSNLFVVKTGIRKSNDLVWVGKAANNAAKLCNIKEDGYPLFITKDVFDNISNDVKYGGTPSRDMWEKRTLINEGLTIFRSNWWWQF